MKKAISVLVCLLVLLGSAAAEQSVVLPGGNYVIELPDWMEYSEPVDGDAGVEAYISADLEMDLISYTREDAVRIGLGQSLKETAQMQREAGSDTEIRNVNGIEMLCFRTVDDADGAPCIGYVFEDGELIIEIDFWYGTQEAGDMTKTIMETIRINQEA